MYKILVALLVITPFWVSAKEYTLPSGFKIDVKEPEIKWVWKEWILPSGLKYIDLIPIAKAQTLTLKDEILLWIESYAQQYKIPSSGMIELAKCESGFDIDILGDAGKALGLYQWWQSSWNVYNKKYGTELERENWKHQVEMTARVLAEKDGWRNWYNCSMFIKYNSWDKKLWK